MAQIPQWANDYIINACLYLESKGYKLELPKVAWRKPKVRIWDLDTNTVKNKVSRKASSGVCYKDHITICAGSHRVDCKMVILHELAHWVNPEIHHSAKFWDTAWDLYRHFKLPVRYVNNREKHYRKGSVIAYRKSKDK